MREIGSEFWEVPISKNTNDIFPQKTKWFLSGRVALKYIIQDIKTKKNVRTAALPSWCCDSMIIPFIQENIEVLFYQVYGDQHGLVQIPDVVADIILVMDYFGYSTKQEFSDYPGFVIRDLTHSIMSNTHQDAHYYFGSVRKWCGINTGGFAYGDFDNGIKTTSPDKNYLDLRKTAMAQKKAYIDGLTDDKGYLNIFAQAEQILDDISCIESADDEDIIFARHLDVDFIKEKRRRNSEVIQKELAPYLLIKDFNEIDCPLFVPIIINNRDALRKYLIDRRIYCPVHWPVTSFHKLNARTSYLYFHELSIVCDQRYSQEDMKRICSAIKKGMKVCLE